MSGFICSFCGKNQAQVLLLIAGPNVYICDECVELCIGIVAEARREKQTRLATHSFKRAALARFLGRVDDL